MFVSSQFWSIRNWNVKKDNASLILPVYLLKVCSNAHSTYLIELFLYTHLIVRRPLVVYYRMPNSEVSFSISNQTCHFVHRQGPCVFQREDHKVRPEDSGAQRPEERQHQECKCGGGERPGEQVAWRQRRHVREHHSTQRDSAVQQQSREGVCDCRQRCRTLPGGRVGHRHQSLSWVTPLSACEACQNISSDSEFLSVLCRPPCRDRAEGVAWAGSAVGGVDAALLQKCFRVYNRVGERRRVGLAEGEQGHQTHRHQRYWSLVNYNQLWAGLDIKWKKKIRWGNILRQ